MEFKDNTPPPLRTDLLTKFKQMIIALPNTTMVLGDNFDDIFATTSLEEFLAKLRTVFVEFSRDTTIDESLRKEVFDSFQFYTHRLLDLYTLSYEGNEEEMKNYNTIGLSYFQKINESNQNTPHLLNNVMSNNPNQTNTFTPRQLDINEEVKPSLHQLLLRKISEASSSILKRVVEIVAPENTFWNTQIFVEELNEDAIKALIQLFEISKDEYYDKE